MNAPGAQHHPLWKGGFRSAATVQGENTLRIQTAGRCCKTEGEQMTGLRGALATMERKLHDFRLNKLVYGADAPTVAWEPRRAVAFAES